MLRSLSLVALFSVTALFSCKSEENEPAATLEGRWNQVSRTDFTYDAQGKLLSQTDIPTPAGKPYLLITSTQVQEHANETVTVYPRYPYTRQQNTLLYADGTKIEIQELTADKLTLHAPGPPVATAPLTEPQGKTIEETHYTR